VKSHFTTMHNVVTLWTPFAGESTRFYAASCLC